MEKTMENRLLLPVLVIIAISTISVLSVGVFAFTVSSPSGLFNVTHNAVAINHTNNFIVNVTIGANNAFTFRLDNSTTTINNSYSQSTPSTTCGSDGFFEPAVRNMTPTDSNLFVVTAETFRNISIFLDVPQFACSPGRYFGRLNITNTSAVSENVTINITIDVPITSSTSAFNNSNVQGNITGVFNGTLPANTVDFHSYYFNTTQITGITGFVVNITANATTDMFLLDGSGNLLAKSILDNQTKTIVRSFSPPATMYEIRIYGNSSLATAYNGFVRFTTLNITNSTPTGTATIFNSGVIGFGTMRATNMTMLNLTIRNDGNYSFNNVVQNAQISNVRVFGLTNGTNSFPLIVPDTATKILVSVNWTNPLGIGLNVTNYTLSLRNPAGTLVATSANSYLQANQSNVGLEEFVETSRISQGIYNVTVAPDIVNGIGNNYTVIAKIFFNPSAWITSNYTSLSNTTFDKMFLESASRNIQINFTVPNDTLDGSYEGFIEYTSDTGATVRQNLNATVQTATLVLNQSLNSSTIQVEENYGQSRNTTVSFSINNTGSLPLGFTTTTNSSVLTLVGGSSVIRFNMTTGDQSLSPGENRTINVTFNISSIETASAQGLWSGWVFFDSPTSHPHEGFNLTLRVNLTDALQISKVRFISSNTPTSPLDNTLNDTTADEDVIAEVQIRYANGTLMENSFGSALTRTNYSMYMFHSNVTSHRVPITGDLQKSSINYDVTSNNLNISSRIFNNTLGGYYDIYNYLVLNFSSNLTYRGGFSQRYLLNNASLLMSSNFSSCSLGESCSVGSNLAGTQNVSVNITNFGSLPTSAIGTVTLNLTADTCSGYRTASLSSTDCASASASNAQWTVSVNPGQRCYISWNVIPVQDASSCQAGVRATPTNRWFSSSGINISFVTDIDSASSSSDSSSSSSSGSSAASTTTSASASATEYLQISKWSSVVEVGQGNTGTSTVTVKNTNDTLTQTVTLKVIEFNGTISTSVSPESASIEAGDTSDFTVTFNVPNETDVDAYTGKFEASSSRDIVSVGFELDVLPGAAAKVKINETFAGLREEVLGLWREINATKAGGRNITLTEEQFSLLKSKLDEAEAFLALGTDQGYFAASELFEEIRNLLKTSKAQLKVDTQGAGFAFPVDPLYIGIGVGIAAVGFLVYLFLPSKGGAGGFKLGKNTAAGAAAGKAAGAASAAKDATGEQFKKLQEKFKLKKDYKYKYSE